MNASAKPAQRCPEAQDEDDPAKGGTKPAHETTHPSEDSPKPHGDAMQHAADEAAKRKAK